MSRDEQERLRDIQDAITAIRRHLEQAGDTTDGMQDAVEGAAGEMDRSAAEFLPTLAPGQALLLGVEFPIPLTIQVSAPHAKPDSRGPNFQEHWSRRHAGDTDDETSDVVPRAAAH
jgi:hypothetical protein